MGVEKTHRLDRVDQVDLEDLEDPLHMKPSLKNLKEKLMCKKQLNRE